MYKRQSVLSSFGAAPLPAAVGAAPRRCAAHAERLAALWRRVGAARLSAAVYARLRDPPEGWDAPVEPDAVGLLAADGTFKCKAELMATLRPAVLAARRAAAVADPAEDAWASRQAEAAALLEDRGQVGRP